MRRGLTLIELLITVVIMSIAAAVVIPSMSQTGVIRVQAAARAVVADVTLAQTEAMAFQVRRGLYFGAIYNGSSYEEGNGYVVTEPTSSVLALGNLSLYAIDQPSEPGTPYVRDLSAGRFGGATIIESDFDGADALVFDEFGSPMQMRDPGDGTGVEALAGNGGSVLIQSPGIGVGYRVRVDAITGRVTVQQEDPPSDEG